MWLVYALLSALFAALTSLLAKIGISEVNSNLATAIRTESTLAFIGLSVPPPTSTWGGIVREGFDNLLDALREALEFGELTEAGSIAATEMLKRLRKKADEAAPICANPPNNVG